ADVIMMLRIQRERLGASLFPSLREYARYFGLNTRRLALARPDVIVMHPGPINRGIELAEDVADGPHSVILSQVEAGVAVRMAVLYYCATEPGPELLEGGATGAEPKDGTARPRRARAPRGPSRESPCPRTPWRP